MRRNFYPFIVSLFVAALFPGKLLAEIKYDYWKVDNFSGGRSLGETHGVTFQDNGQETYAIFRRSAESRLVYPYADGFPKEGYVEIDARIDRAYRYVKSVLKDDEPCALIFTTDIQGGDVTWPGSAWLHVCKNGDVTFHIAGRKYQGGWDEQYRLRAKGTAFRFGTWTRVGIGFGAAGRYISINGQVVAANPSQTEKLAGGGTKSESLGQPTIGESVSYAWNNNEHEGGFEGAIRRVSISKTQARCTADGQCLPPPSCTVKDPDIALQYSGGCVNGLAHGQGTAKGRDTYVGAFADGDLDGKGIYTWADGSRYEGNFSDNKKSGKGTYTWSNGSRYEGEFSNGNRNGFGVMRLVRGDPGISSYGSYGNWQGDLFVVRGMWSDGNIQRECDTEKACQAQAEAERERERQEEARKARCEHLYVGKVVEAPTTSWLFGSGSEQAIVLGFSASQGVATVKSASNSSMVGEVPCWSLK